MSRDLEIFALKEISGCSVCKRQDSSFYLLLLHFDFICYPSFLFATLRPFLRNSHILWTVQLCRTCYAVRHALHSLQRYPLQVGILAKAVGIFLNHRPVVSALCGHSKRSGELKPIRRQYGLYFLHTFYAANTLQESLGQW